MTVTFAPATSFQATDLQRRAREVLDAARAPEGALIRDKDGTNFCLIDAGRLSQDTFTKEGLYKALQVLHLSGLPDEVRKPALYGELGWLAALPVDSQRDFAWDYVHALQDIPVRGFGPVEELLYDWQQTARSWADPDVRSTLLADAEASDDVTL